MKLGKTQGLSPSVISWKSNNKKKNPWWHIYITLKGKLPDANSIMMHTPWTTKFSRYY